MVQNGIDLVKLRLTRRRGCAAKSCKFAFTRAPTVAEQYPRVYCPGSGKVAPNDRHWVELSTGLLPPPGLRRLEIGDISGVFAAAAP